MSREIKLKIFNATLLVYIGTYAALTFGGFGDKAVAAFNSIGLLDYKTMGYTVEEARLALSTLGEEGLALAKKFYIGDFIYIVCGCALKVMITLFFHTVAKKKKEKDDKFNMGSVNGLLLLSFLLTGVKLATDCIENVLNCVAMRNIDAISDGTLVFMSNCTQAKMVSFLLWVPVCILLATILLSKKKVSKAE